MDKLTCDLCGQGLLLDSAVRYEVKIEVKAAYDNRPPRSAPPTAGRTG